MSNIKVKTKKKVTRETSKIDNLKPIEEYTSKEELHKEASKIIKSLIHSLLSATLNAKVITQKEWEKLSKQLIKETEQKFTKK